MKIFLDTNIILDVLTKREPHYEMSAKVFELCRRQYVEGIVSSLSFPTMAYVLRKEMDLERIFHSFEMLTKFFKISIVDKKVVTEAIASKRPDIEDSMQYFSALTSNADCIISRDKTGFKGLDLEVFSPTEFMGKVEKF